MSREDVAEKGVQRACVLSACLRYRYALSRLWDRDAGYVLFVMLNPSTADGAVDDPTIRKCVGFTKRWGFGGIRVCNLFAYRATKPADLWSARKSGVDIVGDRNMLHVRAAAAGARKIVAAWGAHAPTESGVAMAAELCRHGDVWCLGVTRADAPRHPLMLAYHTPLSLWSTANFVGK